MENLASSIGGVLDKLFEFCYKSICFAEIKRTKVCEEWLINKVLTNKGESELLTLSILKKNAFD